MKIVIFFAADILFIVASLWLFRSTKKSKPHNPISIKLEDLSSIWTRYNTIYEEIKPKEPLETLFCPASLPSEQVRESTGVVQSIMNNKMGTETVCKNKEDNGGDGKAFTEKSAVQPAENSDIQEPLRSFWQDCLAPHAETFKQQGVQEQLKTVIEILEQYGNCPSVVLDTKDDEASDFPVTVRDNLAKVSLKEHSYSVARIMYGMAKKHYVDPEMHLPKIIITGLAHDIGKIAEFRLSALYNTYHHPLISASKLSELFAGSSIHWFKQAYAAIKDHHIPSKDVLTTMLKEADKEARQLELIRYTKDYSIKPFESWFDAEQLIRRIEPAINVMHAGNKVNAISLKGIVYVKPDLLYDKAKEICMQAQALDMGFVYESEKESMTRKIIQSIRQKYIVSDLLPLNYHARRFDMKTKMGQKYKHMFVPLRGEHFDLAGLEKRKIGTLETVEAIIPL